MPYKMAAAAILDLKVKMAEVHTHNRFIIFVMPNILEIGILFSIFSHLVEDLLLVYIF